MLSVGAIIPSSQLATRELLLDPEEEEEEEEDAQGELSELGGMIEVPLHLFSFLCDEKNSSLFTTIPTMQLH